MNDIFTIASGVLLGQFVWLVILTIILFIAFKLIIRSIKRKIFNVGFELSLKGTGFVKKINTRMLVNRKSIKNFVNYSKQMTSTIFDRF